MMLGLLRKVLRDILRRPARSLLTVLGIAVGVAGMVAVVSTGRNVVRAQRELFASSAQADIRYWVWDAPSGIVRALESDARVTAAELRVTYTTRWRPLQSWRDIELVGIDDWARVTVNRFDLLEGRFPEPGEMVLELSASLAEGVTPGMEVAYRDAQGRERYLTVVGITRSPGNLSSSLTKVAVAYVPAPFLRNMMGVAGSNQLLIKLQDPEDAQRLAEHVSRLLRRQGLQVGAPEIRDPDRFAGKRELDALILVMLIFSSMALALGSFLVINTLSASVTEQIGEMGTLKALGATRLQVVSIYMLEALAYGLLGTCLGLLAGTIGGWRLLVWIASLGSATVGFELSGAGLALGAAVGIGVALLGGLLPALSGARVSVKEAQSSYGIRADYGQNRLDLALKRLRNVPPLLAMSVRNLGRRRVRTALTLLVVSLSSASFLSAVSMRDSVNTAIAGIYRTYDADAWVWLDQMVSWSAEQSLAAVEGVYTAEGWVIADGHVGLDEARLWGLPAHSLLYREVLREGRWFSAEEPQTVVLSSELADKRGWRAGDWVEIQTHGQARLFQVCGIAIDNTIFLGGQLSGKAFLARESLGAMLRQEGVASLFALGLASRDAPVADAILSQVEGKFQRWKPVVQPVYAEIESAREASRLLTMGLAAMVIIVACVGALGVVNTLTLNVLERRREIAILRTIGATDATLLFAFLAEGTAIGLQGWIAGLLLGYPLARLLTACLGQALFQLQFVFSASTVVGSFLFTLALAILASLAPSLGAARLATASALRYE